MTLGAASAILLGSFPLESDTPMARLEDLKPGTWVKGVLPDALVQVIDAKWHGSSVVELTYKDPAGRPDIELLYRDREPTLEIASVGRPWSFDGDGELFRLVSEAQRIRLAHLFDPVLAVHTSVVDPLPHQITAVYETMLPRQPLRFLQGAQGRPFALRGERHPHPRQRSATCHHRRCPSCRHRPWPPEPPLGR